MKQWLFSNTINSFVFHSFIIFWTNFSENIFSNFITINTEQQSCNCDLFGVIWESKWNAILFDVAFQIKSMPSRIGLSEFFPIGLNKTVPRRIHLDGLVKCDFCFFAGWRYSCYGTHSWPDSISNFHLNIMINSIANNETI